MMRPAAAAVHRLPAFVAEGLAAVFALRRRQHRSAVVAERLRHQVQERLRLAPTNLSRDLVVVEREAFLLVEHLLPAAVPQMRDLPCSAAPEEASHARRDGRSRPVPEPLHLLLLFSAERAQTLGPDPPQVAAPAPLQKPGCGVHDAVVLRFGFSRDVYETPRAISSAKALYAYAGRVLSPRLKLLAHEGRANPRLPGAVERLQIRRSLGPLAPEPRHLRQTLAAPMAAEGLLYLHRRPIPGDGVEASLLPQALHSLPAAMAAIDSLNPSQAAELPRQALSFPFAHLPRHASPGAAAVDPLQLLSGMILPSSKPRKLFPPASGSPASQHPTPDSLDGGAALLAPSVVGCFLPSEQLSPCDTPAPPALQRGGHLALVDPLLPQQLHPPSGHPRAPEALQAESRPLSPELAPQALSCRPCLSAAEDGLDLPRCRHPRAVFVDQDAILEAWKRQQAEEAL
mmetsp:Transcript_10483/g.39581  ORF Transcript_10483/g.39581 Transcript_10483/m.39581 type:complete len:457 (-) Transcript_10483:2070-3440(-)